MLMVSLVQLISTKTAFLCEIHGVLVKLRIHGAISGRLKCRLARDSSFFRWNSLQRSCRVQVARSLSHDGLDGRLAHQVLFAGARRHKDVAASIRLFTDQNRVFAQLVLITQDSSIAAHEFDGRQGRAKFMGGGGDSNTTKGPVSFVPVRGHLRYCKASTHREVLAVT
jgi:hypothetical protein